MNDQNKKAEIVEAYLDFVAKYSRLPSKSDLVAAGFSKSAVTHHFGNYTYLHRYIADVHAEELDKLLVTGAKIFSAEAHDAIDEVIKAHKRFIITTAVVGKLVDEGFLDSIRTYEQENDAKLLILPCADVRSGRKQIEWGFDPLLSGDTFITKKTWLNDNIFLSNILVSAKQIRPSTGLSRFTREGSCIFASPKQFLEYVAVSPSKKRLPRALATTGAITVSNYDNDFYMSQRTSAIAEFDHQVGAIIVEVVDDNYYHIRHVRASIDGSFVDLGKRYHPTGEVTDERVHFYAGDWHSGDTDYELAGEVFKFLKEYKVHDFFVGDFFNGHSISHHHIARPTKLAMKAREGRDTLVDELQQGLADMHWILKHITGTLYLIRGNHDEVLDKYLDQARYVNDPINYLVSLRMAEDMCNGKNALEEAYKRFDTTKMVDWSRVVFLTRDDQIDIGGVIVSQHGDKGANGAKSASLQSNENSLGSCIVGHAHSPAIWREVYRVGTFTKLKLDYNEGPSSWMHNGCLISDRGERQLINFIEGKYKL